MSATEKLARFVIEAKYSDIPPTAIKTAKRAIIDCVGVTIAGSVEPGAEIIADYLQEVEAKPVATVIGRNLRTSLEGAALANGFMAHALDLDDYNAPPMSGHPSVPLVPTVFALGEMLGSTGQDVLLAYVLGFEVEVKLGRVLNPEHYRHGWHATATLGTLGATVAAAKLLGLNVEQTRNALGIATSEAGGSRLNFGTMVKPFHAGNAARSGILAAKLAKRGFTADINILEERMGFCHLFAGGKEWDLDIFTNGLGETWELIESGISIKRYPSCGGTHAAIDAMMDLIQAHNLKPGDVETVEVVVSDLLPQVLIHTQPKIGLEGKFSMQFCMSSALVDRQVSLGQFTDEKVNQPQIKDLVSKTRMTPREPGSDVLSTIVNVKLRDGRTVSQEVRRPKGSPDDPFEDNVIVEKFLDCSSFGLEPQEAKASLELMQQIEALPNLSQLMGLVGRRKAVAAGKAG